MRRMLPEKQRAAWSERITKHVLSSEPFQRAQAVMAFYSFGTEVDTVPLLHAILTQGKRLLLPRCYAGGRMVAKEVSSLDALIPGAYGIPEPSEDAETADPASIDLVLVPGLVFDNAGYRMGYGAGYYDRYLPQTHCMTLGMAFFAQRVPHLDAKTHDVPVQGLATEQGILMFQDFSIYEEDIR